MEEAIKDSLACVVSDTDHRVERERLRGAIEAIPLENGGHGYDDKGGEQLSNKRGCHSRDGMMERPQQYYHAGQEEDEDLEENGESNNNGSHPPFEEPIEAILSQPCTITRGS